MGHTQYTKKPTFNSRSQGPQKTSQGYEITVHNFKTQKKAKVSRAKSELHQWTFQILELPNSEYKMDS